MQDSWLFVNSKVFFINLYTPLSLEELPEGVKDYSEYYMKEYGKKKDSEVKEYTASWLLQDLQRQIELEEENAKQKREKTGKILFTIKVYCVTSNIN